jgi:hypothetical protein
MNFLGLTVDGIVGADFGADGAAVAGICYEYSRPGQHFVTDGILRTVGGADAALNTFFRIDKSQVIFNGDGINRACLFTNSTPRTADLADFPDTAAGIGGVAPDSHKVADRFQGENISWAGHNALVTGSTLFRDNDRKPLLTDCNGIEGTNRLTCAKPYAGIAADLGSPSDEQSRAAVLNTIVFGFYLDLADSAAAMQNGNLLDHIPHFHAKKLSQLGDNAFASGCAGSGHCFPFEKANGKTGAACVSAGTAIQAGKDTFNDFQTGIDINVEFLGCKAESVCGDQPETSETYDCCNHSSISPFRKSP